MSAPNAKLAKILAIAIAALHGVAALPDQALALAMCRLPPDRCRVVLHEMRQLELQRLHDYRNLTGLRPYQRELAVIDRNEVRMREKLRTLPKDVGNELGRLALCDAKDRHAGALGAFNDDPRCQ